MERSSRRWINLPKTSGNGKIAELELLNWKLQTVERKLDSILNETKLLMLAWGLVILFFLF